MDEKEKDKLGYAGMHAGAHPIIFGNAARLRKNMTSSEKKLWEYLKTKPNGFKIRRQHPIARYVLDFYCHKSRLSIELDGGYHLKPEQMEKDRIRSEYLVDLGITEIRFTNAEIEHDFEKCIQKIIVSLRAGVL